MTALAKTAFALLLLAAGFIAAKTFGPPDLAERFVDSWRPAPGPVADGLRAAQPGEYSHERLAPLDAIEMPAQFSSNYPAPPLAAPQTHTVSKVPAQPDWPNPPAAIEPPTDLQPWFPAGTGPLQRSSYEQEVEMVDLSSRSAPAAQPCQPPLMVEPPYQPEPPELSPPGVPAQGVSFQSFEDWRSSQSPADFGGGPSQGPPPLGQGWPAPTNVETTALSYSPAVNEPEADSQRRHIVSDGDSLPKLALRYLGTEERSKDIFQNNRDKLTHPDLLPLGVELVIP